MEFPRISLAIDNCFASKRWTRPREWMGIVRDLGIRHIEASADTECDPLYTVPAYLEDWAREVETSAAQTGCTLANLYTGHGTYSTLGLCHHDARVADHMLQNWLEPMCSVAGRLRAGFGFYCHAFPAAALRDRACFDAQMHVLIGRLAALSRTAAARGVSTLSLEQMYSPNQPPWTTQGARALMQEVWRQSGAPLYLTIDTGHQTGQKRYLRPDAAAVAKIIRCVRAGEPLRGRWPGHGVAVAALERAVTEGRIEGAIEEHAYLFAAPEDADPYAWLAALGRYSPIVHLQQTTGESSSHLAFTPAHNRAGIIAGERVLQALAASYAAPGDPELPPPCRHITLTLEVFFKAADYDEQILDDLRASVEYWRRFIPEDGLRLDDLAAAATDPGSA